MRRGLMAALIGGGLLMVVPSVVGQEAPSPAVAVPVEGRAEQSEPAPGAEVDALFAAWAKQAADRTSLQLDFDRVDRNPKWGDKRYEGRAFFREADLCVEFSRAGIDPNREPGGPGGEGHGPPAAAPPLHGRIIWTPEAVTEFLYDSREVLTFPLRPGTTSLSQPMVARSRQDFDLPFLWRIDPADLRRAYDVSLLRADPGRRLLRFRRRDRADDGLPREALLELDRTTFLPNRLVLFPGKDGNRQDFTFRTIRINEPIDGSVFDADRVPEGWQVLEASASPLFDALRWLDAKLDEWGGRTFRINVPLPERKVEAQ